MKNLNIIQWLWLVLVICLLEASPAHAFYNSQQGRWVNRDPINEKGGLNVYAFIKNQPTAAHDVLGLYKDPGIENIGADFGKCDDRGFWLGVSFKLEKDSAMLSKIQLSGSTTPCPCGPTDKEEKFSKPAKYQFTAFDNEFSFGQSDEASLKRSMLHLSNGDIKCKNHRGNLTIVFEYTIVPATPVPSGFTNSDVDHGLSSPNPPPNWKPTKTHTITCSWDCDGKQPKCTQSPSDGIAESGLDRLGADGVPRN